MKYYNKLLIQELCKDKDICECFLEFSETDSETAIENSRIKDKQCHFKAIKNYTRLFEESRIKLDKESEKNSGTWDRDRLIANKLYLHFIIFVL